MKKISIVFILFLLAVSAYSQDSKPSPAVTTTSNANGVNITVNYSSPAVKGRKIWGGLEAYDKVWRTGANEATRFKVDKDVVINGKTIAAGEYALLTIPTEKDWTVILNSDAKQWGAYNYDEKKDVARFTVTPTKTDKITERLTFTASEKGTVPFNWEYVQFAFDVKAAK